jgi:GTP-binding protein
MFVDSVVVEAAAGSGGHGMIAFRREKHVPKGGPSGGDGGKGGDVVVLCDDQLDTLIDLRYRRHYRATRGAHGSGGQRAGRSGEDAVIRVPPGTLVYDDESGDLLADMVTPAESFIACRGGRGGRGNAAFATPLIRAPREAEDGRSGEARRLRFELKIMADVGLVGRPNAGKSTLLSTVSAARPKVADYPFTTLEPHLGIVRAGEYESFVLADLPGLIEGAHLGKGLGHRFLRHIQRARVLVFLVEITEDDPHAVLDLLRDELERFDAGLTERPSLVTLTKIDLCPEAEARLRKIRCFDSPPLLISSATGEGIAEWTRTVYEYHRRARAAEEPAEAQAGEAGL